MSPVTPHRTLPASGACRSACLEHRTQGVCHTGRRLQRLVLHRAKHISCVLTESRDQRPVLTRATSGAASGAPFDLNFDAVFTEPVPNQVPTSKRPK